MTPLVKNAFGPSVPLLFPQSSPSGVFASPERPFELREPLATISEQIANTAAGGSFTSTPYSVLSIATVGTRGTTDIGAALVFSPFKAHPFSDPYSRLDYVRARWYSPEAGTWLSPDLMGYRDSSNLYAGFALDPVNNRDPRGEAVYVVYRQFQEGLKKAAYPVAGHFYLAFDEADLPDKARWRRLVNQQGAQGDLTGNNPTPRRNANPDAETFSFHPRNVNEYDDKSGMLLSTLVTSGSFIGYNDSFDQESFKRGRAVLNKRAFNPPLDREWVWKIPATQDQQEALYRRAVSERKAINSGSNTFGDYLLNENNCGSWSEYMLTSAGLLFPTEARLCGNVFGIGLGGPMAPVGRKATSIAKKVVEEKEDLQRWWDQIYQGIEAIGTGGQKRWP